MACVRAAIGRRRGLKLGQSRRHAGAQTGGPGLSLAVNGRAGRRVACVLDGEGTGLEMFDMEGDDEDGEEE